MMFASLPPRMPGLHFIGLHGDEYVRAARVFGRPSIIHPRWDALARREIAAGDTLVFATGDDRQPVSRFNGPDILEDRPWMERC